MNTKELTAMKATWEKMSAEYDAYIEQFLANPTMQLSEASVEEMKRMQQELYEVETELFKIIEENL